ncbi:type II toxin-antitoxin system RelE/ParE family toxin, partial [Candidatus Babeliales bacterium]|nr:type II toxin-antitoxin system RelE/ParE family toxin [Candidatus Babeliales bacterium]
MISVVQTPTFSRQIKKLHKNQKKDLDQAVSIILANPLIGEMKKGDLDGIQVYKFRMT